MSQILSLPRPPSLAFVTVFVTFIHLLGIGMLMHLQVSLPQLKEKAKTLTVQTVVLKKKIEATAPKKELMEKERPKVETAPAKMEKELPKAETAPAKMEKAIPKVEKIPPKVEKAPVKKVKAADAPKKKAEAPKKESAAISKRQALVAKAGEALKKIGSSPDSQKKKASSSTFGNVGALSIDHIAIQGETNSYHNLLTHALQRLLLLPEYGAVKIELTVAKTGVVTKVVVLSAQNAKNRDYVEKQLKGAMLAPLTHDFGGTSLQTFTVTLTNE